MSDYLESIKTLDLVGTSVKTQGTPVLEISGEVPAMTYVEPPTFPEKINEEAISYSAPSKVIVRTYRLRK